MEPGTRIDALLRLARTGERTVMMGVLNITPDSFSDGGRWVSARTAVERAREMLDEGADLIDVGGESTRPGAEEVPEAEEIDRVAPVIAALVDQLGAVVSIDTRKAGVAREALALGAAMVNDVSAMEHDPAMANVVAHAGVALCLMHMRGTPATMQRQALYSDVTDEVSAYLLTRADAAIGAGICRDRIVVDPGFGFGKTPAHNLALVRRLREIADMGLPVVLGVSRKSTIGAVLNIPDPMDRVEGAAALVAIGIANGAAIIRAHDVRQMVRVARMADAVLGRQGYSDRRPGQIGAGPP